jgi:hypothetical protein
VEAQTSLTTKGLNRNDDLCRRYRSSRSIAVTWLQDRTHTCHLRNMRPQIPFNPRLQGLGCRRAPRARAVQSQLDDSVHTHSDKLDIASVCLERRADDPECSLHAILDTRAAGRCLHG